MGILAFQGCTSLSSVELSDSLELLEDFAFRGCLSLKEISLKAQRIGCSSFEGCKDLKKVELPHVKAVGDSAFEGCAALAACKFNERFTDIPTNCLYYTICFFMYFFFFKYVYSYDMPISIYK